MLRGWLIMHTFIADRLPVTLAAAARMTAALESVLGGNRLTKAETRRIAVGVVSSCLSARVERMFNTHLQLPRVTQKHPRAYCGKFPGLVFCRSGA